MHVLEFLLHFRNRNAPTVLLLHRNKHYYKVTDLRNASCTIHTLFGNIKTDVKFDTLTGRIEGINITTRMKGKLPRPLIFPFLKTIL